MDEGYKFKRISVNFSASSFRYKKFMEGVLGIVDSNLVPHEKLAMELTESVTDTDDEIMISTIENMKKAGVRVYLDDFGTGYSNFDRILSLGLDVIKFDRSLLVMACKDDKAKFTLNHFSKAFSEIGFKVLFEGVETDEQQALCEAAGADYLQGYKFSKPIPIDELRRFFEKES